MASSELAEFRRLLDDIQNGSEEAARQFVSQFGGFLRHWVRRHLPENLRRKVDSWDIMQSAWGSVFAEREKLADFSTPQDFLRFISRIASRKVYKELRRQTGPTRDVQRERPLDQARVWLEEIGESAKDHTRRRRRGLNDDRPRQIADSDLTPSQKASANETLEQLMHRLCEKRKQIVEMRLAGHSFSLIAQTVSMDERYVRQLYYRIMKKP